jgi:hypothetical protein
MSNPRTLADQDGALVQLPTDGTGKQIAHVLIDETQSDGSTETLYMPRMVISGADGELLEVRHGALQIDASALQDTVQRLTEAVTLLRETLLLIHF